MTCPQSVKLGSSFAEVQTFIVSIAMICIVLNTKANYPKEMSLAEEKVCLALPALFFATALLLQILHGTGALVTFEDVSTNPSADNSVGFLNGVLGMFAVAAGGIALYYRLSQGPSLEQPTNEQKPQDKNGDGPLAATADIAVATAV